jgi:hypothetical protein
MEWRAHFEKYFRGAKDIQDHYDPAQTCLIELNAGELGIFSLKCEREFSPLRWIVRRKGREYELSLLNDSGSASPANVVMLDFAKPDSPVQMEVTNFTSGYSVPASGGLYWAYTGKYECAVIVSPVTQKPTLRELSVQTQVRHGPRSVETVESILVLIKLWSRARDTGLFSAARRRSVLLALLQEVFATIGGERAERMPQPEMRSGASHTSKRASMGKRHKNTLAAQLLRDCPVFAAMETKDRVVRFSSIAKDILRLRDAPLVVVGRSVRGKLLRKVKGPEDSDWLCEFALRLASSPDTLNTWAGRDLRSGLQKLIEMPDLAQAARLIVLAIDRHRHASPMVSASRSRDWEWA